MHIAKRMLEASCFSVSLNSRLMTPLFQFLLFSIVSVAGIFSIQDVFLFERSVRGICGVILCCTSTGFLINGQNRLAITSLFGHYVRVPHKNDLSSEFS